MTAVALVASGVAAALAAAAATGRMPDLRRAPAEPARRSALAQLLRRAGVGVGVVPFVAGSAVLALGVALVVGAITPVRALVVVPAGLAAITPTAIVRRRAAAAVAEVRRAWPDALAQIGGNLRAGRPLSHALIDVSLNGPPALARPLEGLAARIQTVGLAPALQAVRAQVADPVTDRVVEVLVLAHAEGGRIVLDLVDDLATSVADEIAAAEEARTLALEGTLNARVVFALPWLVLVLLTARPGPFQEFYAGPLGAVVIGVGALLSALGIALAARLAAVDEEPRVLVDTEVGR